MATMNLSICDLCNSMGKDGLPFRLILQEKGKRKESIKAEICQACFDDLSSRIALEISFEQINKPTRASIKPSQITEANVRLLDDDVAFVPSQVDYDTAHNVPGQSKCKHDRTSYDHPNVKCKDCGDEWEA